VTERITPAHLRSLCDPSPEKMRYIVLPITVGFLLDLADQMEADERKFLTDKEMDNTAEVIAKLVKRVMIVERERDAIATTVAQYEKIIENLKFPSTGRMRHDEV